MADRYLKTCPNGKEGRKHDFQAGENFYRASASMSRCYEDFFDRAAAQWWDVYRTHDGPGAKTYFYARHYNSPISSYTQMAWSFTRNLGCSIRECQSSIVVSCRYNEVGNRIDYPMYNKGPTCSQCQRMTRCNPSTGLCI
ncbi:hypothetical protein OESDEN_04109 [Oesophagostomum dentatum]|uniref:SCP domain-containing protein n=1 Tax=Oesophagostomum dentatum TaxID=61180 RepID=A0A0B1TF82_OESDE|nr:hypothetical protein OESDEN_04109 [Oesophagostomum dentatum]